MRPDAARKQLGELYRPARIHAHFEQLLKRHLDLTQRFAAHACERHGLVVVEPGHRGHLDDRSGGVLVERARTSPLECGG
jgi:hypothetical protein